MTWLWVVAAVQLALAWALFQLGAESAAVALTLALSAVGALGGAHAALDGRRATSQADLSPQRSCSLSTMKTSLGAQPPSGVASSSAEQPSSCSSSMRWSHSQSSPAKSARTATPRIAFSKGQPPCYMMRTPAPGSQLSSKSSNSLTVVGIGAPSCVRATDKMVPFMATVTLGKPRPPDRSDSYIREVRITVKVAPRTGENPNYSEI